MTIPTPDAICAAHTRIAPHIHRTPTMDSAVFGPRLSFKFETCAGHRQLQGTRRVQHAPVTVRAAGGVVAASGGNHGAAVPTRRHNSATPRISSCQSTPALPRSR